MERLVSVSQLCAWGLNTLSKCFSSCYLHVVFTAPKAEDGCVEVKGDTDQHMHAFQIPPPPTSPHWGHEVYEVQGPSCV